MPARRRLLIPERGVIQPVEDQNLILFDRLAEFVATGALCDPHVKAEMAFMHFVQVFSRSRLDSVLLIELLRQTLDLLAFRSAGLLGEDTRSLGLERLPKDVVPPNCLGRRDTHPCADPWPALHQAVTFQPLQRITNGHNADLHLLGKNTPRQPRAERQLAAENSVTDGIIGMLRQAALE